jgi:cation transport protein ChaC
MQENASKWVFGYGSLIWRPGFAFVGSERALLRGAHRSLCIYSDFYRGTPEVPGLVFGLARGGACGGMAFEVDAEHWPVAYQYLRDRELLGGVYREVTRPVQLVSGRTVNALTYLVDETNFRYAGRLELAEQARVVRRGVGQSGSNIDYVLNTAEHLAAMGIFDKYLVALVALLREDVAAA